MGFKRLRKIITLVALGLTLGHLIWPNLAIDAVTLVLLAAAILPWLEPIFKRLEFPGGLKVEFQDQLRGATNKADSVGLLAPPGQTPPAPQLEYAFHAVAEQDPNLALAGLRIEIERRLQALAEAKGIMTLRMGVGGLLRELTHRGAASKEERTVLADMIGLLNNAVHGAAVDQRAADWALDIGPRLLRALERRVSEAREPGEAEALRKLQKWCSSDTYGRPGTTIPDYLFSSSTHGVVAVSQPEQELMMRKGWIETVDSGVQITERGRQAASLW